MTYPLTKQVCQLNEQNIYIGQTAADLSPEETDEGVYLIPAGCVDTAPPADRQGVAARWNNGAWEYVENHVGETVYSTKTREPMVISEYGVLPKGYTTIAPDSDLSEWNGTNWEISPAKMTALLSEQRATMWARIKQKRHDNLRGGVFVKSVGKWFHTNDESRQQYTFLRTLGNVPQNLMWKTMDNSFVTITKAILDELSLQMIIDEQADFANAERHKALMEQAENPLEYDFSDGWTETYKE